MVVQKAPITIKTVEKVLQSIPEDFTNKNISKNETRLFPLKI